nr:hypothetical protein [Tanacetum cinerariifolium]
MTSFGYRLNPRYAIKECLSCGALYTGNFYCSKGSIEDKILVPKPPENCARCAKCGHPVNGPYCQGCALLREKLEEYLVSCLKYFHESSESSDDSTNVVNAPREPFVVKQDHGVKSSLHPLINVVVSVIPACCDDDDDYDFAITPVVSTEEPIDSLSMGDEHLDTIPAMESDEVIKSSVEDLVLIPSEFEGIPDTMCDVHLVNNSTPLEAKYHVEIVINSNDDISSSDDDSLHEENIDDDQSCSDKDVLEKIVSKPLCDEEIIPKKSLRTHDSSLPI